MSRRIRSLLSLIFGVLGAVGCVAVIIVSWTFASRLNHATEIVMKGFDNAFSTAQQQLTRAGDRVESLKLSAENINAGLKTWGKEKVATRLTSRVRVEESISRLESGLDQTDQWLEVIESSIRLVQQAIETGRGLGLAVKTDAFERLLNEVAAVRIALAEVTSPVTMLREQVSQLSEDDANPDQVSRIASVATRLIATFGSVDSRLDALSVGLTEANSTVRQARTTVLAWVRLAATAITLLACWMAAGQGSLIYLGIKGWKESRLQA